MKILTQNLIQIHKKLSSIYEYYFKTNNKVTNEYEYLELQKIDFFQKDEGMFSFNIQLFSFTNL